MGGCQRVQTLLVATACATSTSAFIPSDTASSSSAVRRVAGRGFAGIGSPAPRKGPNPNVHETNCRLLSSMQDEDQEARPVSKPDASEWQAVTAALKMYKAAYGDLKVPSRFVVPALPPWPEPAWGLKLGQRVASIRSTGKYIQDDDERREQLEDMGFLWRLRAPSGDKNMDGITFDQVYEALVVYQQEVQPEGKINVPSNFIVPNAEPWLETTRGMPLGKKIPIIRSKAYLKENPGAADRLAKLGFEFDGKVAANDQRYNKVYNALKRYKELNGDLLVPQPFVVPENSEDWSEETWGLRLGARVNAIRSQGTFVKTNPDRREELDELGFEWELLSEGKKRGRKRKEEIEALKGPAPPGLLDGGFPGSGSSSSAPDPYSDSLFPFPDQKETKTLSWGFEDEDEDENALPQLAAEEFLPPKNLNETLAQAAEVAKSVGIIQGLDEENRIIKGKKERSCPWYIDDFGDDFVFEDVVEALTVCKDGYGSFDILNDEDFVVPDPTESLFGSMETAFDVESSAAAAAAIAAAERGEGGNAEDLISAEIERLESTLALDNDEDEDDIESDEDDDKDDNEVDDLANVSVQWPEHLAGMRLGNIVRRIRDGSLEVKHLRDRKRKLDAIGFDWGDPKKFLDIPFEKSMCAMFAYYQIRGDMMVDADFYIPDEVPWPKALAGYELGKTVMRVRELQNFFEAFHSDKVALLKMVEFYWFPDVALPLDPFSWGETTEDEFLAAVGVPFYWLGEEQNYPAGIVEKLLTDGPTDNPDPTVKWYNYDHVREYWETESGTEVIQFFDDKFGAHLPAEVLWRLGLPKLAREQEARFAAGKLGEIASERFEVETDEDNLLRPIIKSMSDIQILKSDYDSLKAQLAQGEIDQAKFESEKVPIEWKVEDIISRLKGTTKTFKGGIRGEGARVKEKREAFSVKEAAYEKEVEKNWDNYETVVKKRFPGYDPDLEQEWDLRWEKARAAEADALGVESEADVDEDGEVDLDDEKD